MFIQAVRLEFRLDQCPYFCKVAAGVTDIDSMSKSISNPPLITHYRGHLIPLTASEQAWASNPLLGLSGDFQGLMSSCHPKCCRA
jgi:hypothetical protein